MLDGKANGRSQRFLSIHSVASSLEKPLLAGQSRLGHHESVTDICHRRMLKKILAARPPEILVKHGRFSSQFESTQEHLNAAMLPRTFRKVEMLWTVNIISS